MTGSVGFGVGVTSGTNDLIKPSTSTVMMKYWLSDSLAIMPELSLLIQKAKDQDASWSIGLGAVAMFNLLRGASTRFDAGVGLRFPYVRAPRFVPLPDPVRVGGERFRCGQFLRPIL